LTISPTQDFPIHALSTAFPRNGRVRWQPRPCRLRSQKSLKRASGPAALATEFSFKQLQKAAEDAGVTGVPADRSVLKDLHTTTEGDTIGEGSVVPLIGFLIKGKFSNVGKGETVNCELPDREENDIHLNVVKDKPPVEPTAKQLQDLECRSVVVEISPHFRREQWEPLGRLVKTTANAPPPRRSPPWISAAHTLHWASFLRRVPQALHWDHSTRQLTPRVRLGDSPGLCHRGLHQHLVLRLPPNRREQVATPPQVAASAGGRGRGGQE
jgi:hypothetical protein